MALDQKQYRYWERFFPGLIAAVEQLGPGEFNSGQLRTRPSGSHNDAIAGIWLRLIFSLKDGHDLKIEIQLNARHGTPPYMPESEAQVDLCNWQRKHYALHYGVQLGDAIFRFDLDQFGHHVHILPNVGEHVSCDRVTPNVKDIDPREFIRMVAAYRNDGTYPVRKKL
ncbi:MAG: hypothetical protein IPM54_23225 [Polyangiaceae bacterium]|nr:hypothetical protein [Polyangiaceae bacterium]